MKLIMICNFLQNIRVHVLVVKVDYFLKTYPLSIPFSIPSTNGQEMFRAPNGSQILMHYEMQRKGSLEWE